MTENKDNKSADRILAILEAFESQKRSLTLRELADYCSIPVSTCHALVHTLINHSYLYQTSRRKDLYPTRRLLDLAERIVEHDPYLERLAPMLEQLRNDTQETVILGKRQLDQVLYLEVLESRQTIRYSSRAGALKPLHTSCIGKVMLGALSPAELQAWLKDRMLPKVTGRSITGHGALQKNLDECRERGYYVTRGENVPDVTAIAVPIVINTEMLGIAVAGPSHRMSDRIETYARLLLQAQSQLQRQGIAA